MDRNEAPRWAQLLTDDDEWVVRTALANAAADLNRVAEQVKEDAPETVSAGPAMRVFRESAERYERALKRIEMADVAEELVVRG